MNVKFELRIHRIISETFLRSSRTKHAVSHSNRVEQDSGDGKAKCPERSNGFGYILQTRRKRIFAFVRLSIGLDLK